MPKPTETQILHAFDALNSYLSLIRKHFIALESIGEALSEHEKRSLKKLDDVQVVADWLLDQVSDETTISHRAPKKEQ